MRLLMVTWLTFEGSSYLLSKSESVQPEAVISMAPAITNAPIFIFFISIVIHSKVLFFNSLFPKSLPAATHRNYVLP